MIYFFAYRSWAIAAITRSKLSGTIITDHQDFDWDMPRHEHDVFIFIGWSWIVKSEFVSNNLCLCYHPSNLPKYRGGTPLQHQIIDGIKTTQATLFRMDHTLDGGPIIIKKDLNLLGCIKNIFDNLEDSAANILDWLCDQDLQNLKFEPQQLDSGFIRQRRKPDDAILTLAQFKSMSQEQIYDFVRCQQEPYPVAKLKLTQKRLITLNLTETYL